MRTMFYEHGGRIGLRHSGVADRIGALDERTEAGMQRCWENTPTMSSSIFCRISSLWNASSRSCSGCSRSSNNCYSSFGLEFHWCSLNAAQHNEWFEWFATTMILSLRIVSSEWCLHFTGLKNRSSSYLLERPAFYLPKVLSLLIRRLSLDS